MKNIDPIWPPPPTNQTAPMPAAVIPLAGWRWGLASICLVGLALSLFTLVNFCPPLLSFRYFWRIHLGWNLAWDFLLLLGYISGRIGWKTVAGKLGVGLSILLLFVDLPLELTQFWRDLAERSR